MAFNCNAFPLQIAVSLFSVTVGGFATETVTESFSIINSAKEISSNAKSLPSLTVSLFTTEITAVLAPPEFQIV